MFRVLRCGLIALVLIPILGSCGPSSQAPAAQTIIVADAAALLKTLAPSTVPLDPPAPASAEAQAAWASPVDAWMQIGTQAVSASSQPEAARTLAYLAVALHDGLLVADLARTEGMAVSDDALLAALADTILTVQSPLAFDQTRTRTATWVGVWEERSDVTAVATGIAIGQAVAADVLVFLADDRALSAASDPPVVYRPSDPAHGNDPLLPDPEPGVWQLTPPSYLPPALPQWGALQPLGVMHLDDLNVVAPPAWDSRRFVQARDAFAVAQADRAAALTAQRHDLVEPPAPVAVWMQQTHDLIAQAQASMTTQDIARIYAVVTTAMHDGYILAYRGAYDHMVERPITWMQQTDPTWTPARETPPTPSYPCETAVVSAAASTVLIIAFPEATDALVATSTALRESGVRDGIQWPIDVDAGNGLGEALGRRLGRRVQR